MAKKKVLVSGGAGFIGSFLCDRFLADGCEVFAVDNLHTGSEKNLAHHKSSRDLHFLKHDIIQPLAGAAAKERFDVVMNFACPASPVHYQTDPVYTMKTNVYGTLNLLETARTSGAVFFQASTSEVYGDPSVHPQPESYRGNVNSFGPRSCYDEGKRAAESLCFDFVRMHKLNLRVVRIFNTYGPRMALNDGRVVTNFLVQALRGEDITVYGDGKQTRSFCYVDDLVDGIFALLNSHISSPTNLGNDGEFTMLELADKVLKYTGAKSKISFEALPKDDPKQRRPDLTKARRELGWSPGTTLDQGLQKAIPYFKEALKS